MMEWMALYWLVVGLVIGSFLNVVGLRLPAGTPFTTDRSRCPACGRTIRALELIPVFSYIALRGRCRGCGEQISKLYPVMELATGSLFAVTYVAFGYSPEWAVALLFLMMLHVIVVSDLRFMLIPDKVLLAFGLPILLLRLTAAPLDVWWSPLAGALLGFSLLFVIALVSRGGMGGGDVKLFAVLGVVLGWELVLLAFFFSVSLGAVLGGIGLITGHVRRKEPMPFGPFIAAGALLAYGFGEAVLQWYTGFWL
ncbi:leader peptidase (prepilin peptidase)/N-methyltransferase [Salsuginibacillus halophilus]|uniref:Prepilin leader peptidase/N-methyltransferase n=1 Tax=Salsuginibacillus halophilus TaxID=517424 RepID=A0A2P8HCM2_9BACI|nr:A24 family peptidase [Salsuginibacillus halophilus]PSL43977.1 leader peptidase (prepilin peptidase)/N-methyltransferase [Salsuginibacillus halophilus]